MIVSVFVIIFVLYISFLLLKHTYRKSNGIYLNVFYISYYILQLAIACIILCFDSDFRLWNDYNTKLSSAIIPFSFAILTANIGFMLGNSFSRKFVKQKYSIPIENQLEIISEKYNLRQLSFFFLILFSFSILTSLDISYAIAVFALTFSFSPIFVGFLWRKLSKTDKRLWILFLAINVAFHTMQGSRGSALFPVIFAILGYLVSIKHLKTLFKRKLILFVLIGLVTMPMLSFIASFREINGRGMEVSMDTFISMIEFAQEEHKVADEGNDLNQTLGRMLIQSNVSTPLLSPEPVPFRYFDSFGDEIISIFSLSGESGRDDFNKRRENLGFGTGVATRYGYHVTDTTSVEWPIFADALSRFGYWGLFIYSFLFAWFLSFLEKKCINMMGKNALLSLTLHLFVLYNGVLSYMFSYYAFMKLLVFRLPLVLFSVWMFSKLIKRKHITL